MEVKRSRKWDIADRGGESEFEHSEKTRNVRFLFTPVEKHARTSLNKFYSSQLLNCKQIAFFLDIEEKEVRQQLQKNKIYPAFYRKRSALFYVGDVIRLAKRLNLSFTIPVGFFNSPEYLYVGREVISISKLWHEKKTKRYTSIFELIMEEGIPVQTIVIAPSHIKYLEDAFLTVAGKLFTQFNCYAQKFNKPLKHLYLCTTPGNREYANKLVERYNKKFKSFLVAIDIDHLYNLRERFAKIHNSN